jgi:hypothetical protein
MKGRSHLLGWGLLGRIGELERGHQSVADALPSSDGTSFALPAR